MKAHIQTINSIDQNNEKSQYLPFENELDLCCMVRIERDNRKVGAFLLNQGDIKDENQFQVVFAFQIKGVHNQLYPEEVTSISASISEAMKSILPGEKCTFLLGRYSDDSVRQENLNNLIAWIDAFITNFMDVESSERKSCPRYRSLGRNFSSEPISDPR